MFFFHSTQFESLHFIIGTLNSQSSNDESRPSTHPDEYSQQPQKRFINVEKYLDESSSDSGSPLKTLHDIRYVDLIFLILPRSNIIDFINTYRDRQAQNHFLVRTP